MVESVQACSLRFGTFRAWWIVSRSSTGSTAANSSNFGIVTVLLYSIGIVFIYRVLINDRRICFLAGIGESMMADFKIGC